MKNLIVSFAIAIICSFQANATRTLYVDGFASILGDMAAEDELLSYSQVNGIDELLLYELHIVNATYNITDFATSGILADFIAKAKDNYGIVKIGAVGENAMFFNDVIIAYNDSRSDANERIDILNLEFEFWVQASTDPGGYYCNTYLIPNGYPCTNDGAYEFVLSQLSLMNQLANGSSHPITTEMYVGWPTLSQSDSIGGLVDRLHLHAYVSDPNTAYNYAADRIFDFGSTNLGIDVSIIFSSEPNFMQNWLINNSMTSAETIFYDDWQNATSIWNDYIDLVGFTYFAYGFNQNVTVSNEEIELPEQITISPNPANNRLTITCENQIEAVRIYDQLGKLILESRETEIDLRQVKSGLYSVQVITDQDIKVMKVVKN